MHHFRFSARLFRLLICSYPSSGLLTPLCEHEHRQGTKDYTDPIMNGRNSSQGASADAEPKHVSTARWTPANGIEAVTTATPASASPDEPKSPPAKRRREERERSRVSRACDRCKK
ncbi:hypothetical protein IG631_04043 [Alternaria alternata]|nr:hypothetical protein IG631_04043 [Alternaria alternata]